MPNLSLLEVAADAAAASLMPILPGVPGRTRDSGGRINPPTTERCDANPLSSSSTGGLGDSNHCPAAARASWSPRFTRSSTPGSGSRMKAPGASRSSGPVQPVDRTGTSRVGGGAGGSETIAWVDLSEIRAWSRVHPDTRSPSPASTSASAVCHHGAASGCGELIGHVGAGRGVTARRNHRNGLTG
jgi:hypothetical protein